MRRRQSERVVKKGMYWKEKRASTQADPVVSSRIPTHQMRRVDYGSTDVRHDADVSLVHGPAAACSMEYLIDQALGTHILHFEGGIAKERDMYSCAWFGVKPALDAVVHKCHEARCNDDIGYIGGRI